MLKRLFRSGALLMGVMLLAVPAMAAEGEVKIAALNMLKFAVIAVGWGLGFAAGLCGLGQGMSVKAAMEGIARNPEAAGKIQVAMIIGLAMIEALTIYALVVALIVLFADPFKAVALVAGH